MRRNIFIHLLLVLVACSAASALPVSNADNPHNMSGLPLTQGVKALEPAYPGESVADQICVFCHTPHSASPESALWSRPSPKGPLGTGAFPIYAAALIAGDPALTGYDATSDDYPSGASRMCLSCHDGTTSIGILLDNTMITMDGSEFVTNDNIQGIVDLSSSHPISFNYNQDVVDYINITLGQTDYQLPLAAYTPLDGNGQMQCTTCHDPHEDTRISSGEDLPFWRHQGTPSVGSTLYDDVCNSCHTDRTTPTVTPPPTHPEP